MAQVNFNTTFLSLNAINGLGGCKQQNKDKGKCDYELCKKDKRGCKQEHTHTLPEIVAQPQAIKKKDGRMTTVTHTMQV